MGVHAFWVNVLQLKYYNPNFVLLLLLCKYTVSVFRHSRRGHQISLQMVVSHHMVAGI
ncbi:mCG147883 [Mus musculus]|nr:mCG147883 [Mus musculus]